MRTRKVGSIGVTRQSKDTPTSRWLSYRPEIKVVDCTIRDGGLMNNHHFDDHVVKAVYEACIASGIDYMEIGYRASSKDIKLGEHGCWKYCREEDIRRIVGDNATSVKLSIMADAGKCDYQEDIPAKKNSLIDLVRVACYVHQVPLALDMLKDARDKGYETTVNLMAVTTVGDSELEAALRVAVIGSGGAQAERRRSESPAPMRTAATDSVMDGSPPRCRLMIARPAASPQDRPLVCRRRPLCVRLPPSAMGPSMGRASAHRTGYRVG